MKKGILLTIILAVANQLAFAQLTLPPSGDNQKSIVTQYIGSLVHVTISYNSPDVHSPSGEDRTGNIWGQLVPYGLNDLGYGLRKPAPWRAGANENTTISFSHDVQFQGKAVKAGTYGFHVIVEPVGTWTIILSNNSASWGSYYYDPKDNALMVQSTPQESEYNEWLTFEFIDRQPAHATAALKWENIMLPFTISVPDMKEIYVQNIRKELKGVKGFSWINWDAAANYALQNETHLQEALGWINEAISSPFFGNENFQTLFTKAQLLSKLSRQLEAEAIMDEAIRHGSATVLQVHNYGRQLVIQGKYKKALEVFLYNAERFNGIWPTNVGLARGYSAVGDFANALKYAELALAEAPDQLNKDSLREAITKLQMNEDIN